ncbi:Transmembrane protein 87A [Bagarius yarrelli]|uniref:Transmembrane protein 87A n=1 Tax=Bagarius yarrelli TaxID=175774 RepID=A0A556U997_BAGYA|nr:Transmembrane protein 87A [Bagarius yarrelli]
MTFNVSWYLRSSICYNEVFSTPDSAASSMFGWNHMLKKDWSGFYSQGYVYFDSCSALFTPKEGKSINQTSHVLQDKPFINEVAKSWSDSPYMFIVRLKTMQHSDTSRGRKETGDGDGSSDTEDPSTITMTVKMEGSHDYSSPADWPLMMFFMIMCIVYVLFGALWLLQLACYWRDLLRIQFWIGAVIILGMLEKAVFYSEYQSIRYYGTYNQSAVIFAELLSALKRSLARILLIIVSLGYGIVKPRLGTTLPRLVAVGMLYLIFSSVEGILRVTGHFTNTLIFSVLVSIIFIIWTTRQFRFVDCQSDWRDIWVDDAFWRLLFSTILLVIMVLLRPSVNSQRFSHSPLIDEDDEDATEPMLNEVFEGVKMRGAKSEAGQKLLSKESSQDEDLKWVEENIPTSVVDVTLPMILDDKEELLKTKLERSKME